METAFEGGSTTTFFSLYIDVLSWESRRPGQSKSVPCLTAKSSRYKRWRPPAACKPLHWGASLTTTTANTSPSTFFGLASICVYLTSSNLFSIFTTGRLPGDDYDISTTTRDASPSNLFTTPQISSATMCNYIYVRLPALFSSARFCPNSKLEIHVPLLTQVCHLQKELKCQHHYHLVESWCPKYIQTERRCVPTIVSKQYW